MHEPDVTLTDYLLAIECAVLAILLLRQPTRSPRARTWAVIFFLGLCVASIAGGTAHGFFPDEESPGFRGAWLVTLYAIGMTALAVWMLGALVLFRAVGWRFRSWAYGQFAAYFGLTGFVTREFWATMLTYIPASLFLTWAVVAAFRRDRDRSYFLVLAGLGLTFVGAAVQQLHVNVHPVFFNHNALYHVIQGLALLGMFLGCRRLLQPIPVAQAAVP